MVKDNNKRRRILVITIWERMWAMEGEAGVSDDYHFVSGFSAAGWDVHFLAPESAGEGNAFPGATVHRYPNFFAATRWLPGFARRLLWLPLFHLIVGPRALRLARALEPDFILGHSHYTTRVTWRCRQKLGIPSGVKLFGVMDLVHTHWPRARYVFKNLEQLIALRYPQLVWIVLDDGTRGDEVIARCGIARERIRFLPNGVDLEWQNLVLDRSRARASFEIGDDDEVVLFLARLVPSKRPADVIRAAAVVLRERPRALFVVAGDGPERAACRRLASTVPGGDRIRFPGPVAHARVPELMAAANLFVATSSLTNMALPTCEALICGVPVVAYDTGTTSRVVRDGETGRLVTDGDVPALSAAITDLLSDGPARDAMAERGRALARALFTSWGERVATELAIVESLVQGRVPPRDETVRSPADTKKGGGNPPPLH